ncbi:hypothetical protein X735_32685 [Mesorhizobium sp. L2C085B000]|nr:hypothetical protein X735_32685 [Mesorhizobium sp. L2C085B000]
MTRRTTLQSMIALAGGAVAAKGISSSAFAQENLTGSGEVRVYKAGGVWGDAQQATFFDAFEKATGIKVVGIPYIDDGAIRASVLAGEPAYDVAGMDGALVDSYVEQNLLEQIDYSYFRPGDREDFSPIPATPYLVPSLFYSMIIAFDSRAFPDKAPQTWTDMWNVEQFPGKRAIADAGNNVVGSAVFEIALLADGVDPKSIYPIDFDRAFKSLDKLKPSILRYWTAGAEPPQLLTDSQVSVTSAWNGRITALKAKNVPVDLSWNQAVLQWEGWSVLKGAKNKENAMKFLAFVAQPEPQAKFSEMIEYGPPNHKAFSFLNPDRTARLPGNPDSFKTQLVQDYSFWGAKGADGKRNAEKALDLWREWVTR